MFLKLWVGMHIRPSSIYGYSGATTKAKTASDPHPSKQSHLKNLTLKCQCLNMFLNRPIRKVEAEFNFSTGFQVLAISFFKQL